MVKKILFCLLFFVLSCGACAGEAAAPLPALTEGDRVLILAPHPDDETIGASGVLQEAARRHLPVKVVYFTNGDSNELSFIVYEKRLIVRKKAMIFMGEVRRREAREAMRSLGLGDEDLIFLGYPDAGTMAIFLRHWGKTRPYRSLLTRVTSVPYRDSFSFGAPYAGESILKDLEAILSQFRPTKIFVSHPVDTNGDHRALYLFLHVALWDLEGVRPAPEIFPYLIHVVGWPKPRGFHPEQELRPPEKLLNTDIGWFRRRLTQDEVAEKKEMIRCYRSQIEYNPPYLYTFARQNELFGDYASLVLYDQDNHGIDWDAMERQSRNVGHPALDHEREYEETYIESLVFAKKDGDLYIRAKMKRWMSEFFGVHVDLLGYRRGVPFAQMPKFHIYASREGGLKIYEKHKRAKVPGASCDIGMREFIIRFPLSSLGNPEFILSCGRSRSGDIPLDETAWRILKLKG